MDFEAKLLFNSQRNRAWVVVDNLCRAYLEITVDNLLKGDDVMVTVDHLLPE